MIIIIILFNFNDYNRFSYLNENDDIYLFFIHSDNNVTNIINNDNNSNDYVVL